MPELLAVVLVCATGMASADCDRGNALDVLSVPARSRMECLTTGSAIAAGAGLPGGDGRTIKILCEPRARRAAAEPR